MVTCFLSQHISATVDAKLEGKCTSVKWRRRIGVSLMSPLCCFGDLRVLAGDGYLCCLTSTTCWPSTRLPGRGTNHLSAAPWPRPLTNQLTKPPVSDLTVDQTVEHCGVRSVDLKFRAEQDYNSVYDIGDHFSTSYCHLVYQG